MWASKDEYGFRYVEAQLDCVLEINKEHISGRGQRERSRWKAVVEELKKRKLVESGNGMDYVLTRLGFEAADHYASRYDTSLNPHYYLDSDGVSAEHIVKIKKALESLTDTTWVKSQEDHLMLAKEPWRKFKCNNIILRDEHIQNPDYGNGLIKTEPYDFYDEGILVGNSGREIKVESPGIDGEVRVRTVSVDVVYEVSYRSITAFDENGNVNNPYPTLYCRFKEGNPYNGVCFIDKVTRKIYEDNEIVEGL